MIITVHCYYRDCNVAGIILQNPCSYRFYAIVVVRGGHPPIEPSDLVAGPYTPGAIYYIAAAWDHNHIASVPDTFIVGDGFQTVANNVQYDNVRLNASTLYSIFVRIEIQSDTEEVSTVWEGGREGGRESVLCRIQ